jgi:hypothetical protein
MLLQNPMKYSIIYRKVCSDRKMKQHTKICTCTKVSPTLQYIFLVIASLKGILLLCFLLWCSQRIPAAYISDCPWGFLVILYNIAQNSIIALAFCMTTFRIKHLLHQRLRTTLLLLIPGFKEKLHPKKTTACMFSIVNLGNNLKMGEHLYIMHCGSHLSIQCNAIYYMTMVFRCCN